MGGSVNQPDFTNLLKLMLKMISTPKMGDRFLLSASEKTMLLHKKILKLMLGSDQPAELIGTVLCRVCKDDPLLSKKVCKLLLKQVNTSNSDTFRQYMTAISVLLRQKDSTQLQKLEWILGVSQILNRKDYRSDKQKFGLELLDKVGDEATIFVSPILTSFDDPLLARLLKLKGRQDAMAVSCLRELLVLMTSDSAIARYVYNSPAPTYQNAHYSDWFRSYLQMQKADIERTNSFAYNRQKYDDITFALEMLNAFD
jgi:hypothetical protein